MQPNVYCGHWPERMRNEIAICAWCAPQSRAAAHIWVRALRWLKTAMSTPVACVDYSALRTFGQINCYKLLSMFHMLCVCRLFSFHFTQRNCICMYVQQHFIDPEKMRALLASAVRRCMRVVCVCVRCFRMLLIVFRFIRMVKP